MTEPRDGRRRSLSSPSPLLHAKGLYHQQRQRDEDEDGDEGDLGGHHERMQRNHQQDTHNTTDAHFLVDDDDDDDDDDNIGAVVKLNVGGRLFVTTRATLLHSTTSSETTFFSALLTPGQHHQLLDGGIFVDRDPRLFDIILTYMRTGYVRSASADQRELLNEAEFYGLSSLARALSLQIPSDSCGGIYFDGWIPCPSSVLTMSDPATDDAGTTHPAHESTTSNSTTSTDASLLASQASVPSSTTPSFPKRVSSRVHPANDGVVSCPPTTRHEPRRDERSMHHAPTPHVDGTASPVKQRSATEGTSHRATARETLPTKAASERFKSRENENKRLHGNPRDDEDVDDGAAVVKIVSSQLVVAIAHKHHVCCYRYSESKSWTLLSQSARIPTPIDNITLNIRSNSGRGGDNLVAIASGATIYLWQLQPHAHLVPRDAASPTQQLNVGNAPPLLQHQGPHAPVGEFVFSDDEDDEPGTPDAAAVVSVSLTVPVDHLQFIHNNLVAISMQGKIGVRNARTHVWQVQDIGDITCHASSGTLLMYGTEGGRIYLVDLQKFPLRLKDNDLLITHLYTDEDRAPITALSIYSVNSGADHCVEIAYGTSLGHVRVILQHPENVGQSPILYKTYRVHLCPIKAVKLNRSCLISVCSNSNHVREWKITRFRGRISTQPGTQALASFSLPSSESSVIGPYGDVDEEQVFVQQPCFLSDYLIVTPTSVTTPGIRGSSSHGVTGHGDVYPRSHPLTVTSADGSPMTTYCVHEGSMSTRAGAHSVRLLFTGHLNGNVQIWNLLSSDGHPHAPLRSSLSLSRSGSIVRINTDGADGRDLGFVSPSVAPPLSFLSHHHHAALQPARGTESSRRHSVDIDAGLTAPSSVLRLRSYHRHQSMMSVSTSEI